MTRWARGGFLFSALFAALVFCPPAPGRAETPSVQTLSYNATANANAGYPHLAIYDLERALAQDPNNLSLLRTDARLLASTGHPRLARVRWGQLIGLSPGDPEALAALQDVTVTSAPLQAVVKADTAPEGGLGLWMSGGGRDQVKAVNVYNTATPSGQHVRYLFVRVGSWVLDGGQSRWDLDMDQALIAADELGGDATVYLWLDGSSQGAANVDAATWERMATELAGQVAQHRLGGVLLAPACCDAPLYPLYAALRRHLNTPLGVEVPADEPAVYQVADFAVLRPVAPGGDLVTYQDRVQDLATQFLATATAVGGKGMVGLNGLNGTDPAKWFEDGRHAVTKALPLQGDAFLGLAVWGLVADDEGQVSELVPDLWKLMQLPLEHP
jgi:hypothetical protein